MDGDAIGQLARGTEVAMCGQHNLELRGRGSLHDAGGVRKMMSPQVLQRVIDEYEFSQVSRHLKSAIVAAR